jgi:predicted DNA binding CopG/RHH family protein
MSGHESRPANSNPLGKCDRRIDIPVSEVLEERLITMASLNGMTKAEYARRLLERAMFGEFSIAQMMASDRQFVNPTNIG